MIKIKLLRLIEMLRIIKNKCHQEKRKKQYKIKQELVDRKQQ